MEVLGVIAFFVSLGLAGLEVWRTFWRKPNLQVEAEWDFEETTLKGITFYAFNSGHRKAVLAKAGVRCTDDESPRHYRSHLDVWERLPIVLDVDEASPRYQFPARLYMREGKAVGVVIEDHKGRIKEFPLPKMEPPSDYRFRRQ